VGADDGKEKRIVYLEVMGLSVFICKNHLDVQGCHGLVCLLQVS